MKKNEHQTFQHGNQPNMGYVAIDDVKMQIVVIGEVNDVAAVTFSTVAIIKQQ